MKAKDYFYRIGQSERDRRLRGSVFGRGWTTQQILWYSKGYYIGKHLKSKEFSRKVGRF